MLSRIAMMRAAQRRVFSTAASANGGKPAGVPPTLARTASAMDKLNFVSDGATNQNYNAQPFQVFDTSVSSEEAISKLGLKTVDKSVKPIIPKYWTGTSAVPYESFIVDGRKKFDFFGSATSIVQKVQTAGQNGATEDKYEVNKNCRDYELLKAELDHLFETQGFWMLKTGITDRKIVAPLMSVGQEAANRYSGGSNLRGHVEENIYDTGAPLVGHLHYHHEMAYVANSVDSLSFMCFKAPKTVSGSTFVSHNVGATDEILSTEVGQKMKARGTCYVRKLPDLAHFKDKDQDPRVVYNFWQTSFETEDMDEAEERAREKGLEVEWVDSKVFGRYMLTKFYISAYEYCPFTDRNLLYAQVADNWDWFDAWPGMMDLAPEERPLAYTYGDDEPMTREERQAIVDAYDNNGIPLDWEVGDIAKICNYRTAHGRPAIILPEGEERELGVRLGNYFRRQGDLPDKW